MGFKLQSFHSIKVSCFSSKARRTYPVPAKSSSVKVVGPDGRVAVYHRPVKAEELMKEHSFHLICRSDSLVLGQKLPALSAADELQMGQRYFILPSQFFQSVLSFAVAKGVSSLRHFDIHLMGNGMLQIKIGEEDEYEDEMQKDGILCKEMKKDGILCTSKEMMKEYEKLVGPELRRWRPELESIVEPPERRKMMRGGVLRFRDFGGFRRKI